MLRCFYVNILSTNALASLKKDCVLAGGSLQLSTPVRCSQCLILFAASDHLGKGKLESVEQKSLKGKLWERLRVVAWAAVFSPI